MSNDPQDYSGAFNEDILAKVGVTTSNDQGMLEVPGVSYAQTLHESNPDHVLVEGGQSLADAIYRLKTDSWRVLPAMLKLFQHYVGWPTVGSRYGGGAFTPFNSNWRFKAAGAGDGWIDCYCDDGDGGILDPRSADVWSGIAWDLTDVLSAPTGISAQGCPVMPWCLVRFKNSVFSGEEEGSDNVECLMLYPDFSSLPDTVSISDTFRIYVDQDVTNCMVALDADEPVLIDIHGEYYQPEGWLIPDDHYSTLFREVVREYTAADWGAEKIITVKDEDGADCRCAFPFRDRQNNQRVWGTFKIEVSADAGATYSDQTRKWDHGMGNYPRFIISGKMRTSEKTQLILGPTDADPSDYTAGMNKIRVRICVPVAEAGDDPDHPAFARVEARCNLSIRDYMNFVGDKTTIAAKDINSLGQHFFCSKHATLPSENADNYTWDCAQCGSCPFFQMKSLTRVDELSIGQIVNNQNILLQQSAPGSAGAMDFVYYRPSGGGPSLSWLMNPIDYFTSNFNSSFSRRRIPEACGQYVFVDADSPTFQVPILDGDGVTVIGHHEFIKFVRGMSWNFACDMDAENCSWPDNILGDNQDLLGILPRRLGSEYIPLTQLSETRDDENDPAYQLFTERCGRKIALGVRDVTPNQSAIAFSNREFAGIEGENRVQRAREKTKFISGIDTTVAGTTGPSNWDRIRMYSTPQTIQGVSDVLAVISLRANGKQNYGRKRIGGAGPNGQILRMEDAGLGMFNLHAFPGLYVSTYIESAGDESHTVYVPWWGSGNAVELPPHYKPNGAVGNPLNNCLHGSLAGKAVAGDTVEINGNFFLVVKAMPSVGDDFSGRTTRQIMQNATLGVYVDFQEFLGDSTPTIAITDIETQFLGSVLGTYASIFGYLKQIPNTVRPYAPIDGDSELGNPYCIQDIATNADPTKTLPISAIYQGGDGSTVIEFPEDPKLHVGSVIYLSGTDVDGLHTITSIFSLSPTPTLITNRPGPAMTGTSGTWLEALAGNLVQVGSQRIYFDQPIYYQSDIKSAEFFGYNNVRVSFSVDGTPQTPKGVAIRTPRIAAPKLDTGHLASVQVFHRNRTTNEITQLPYGGVATDPNDPFESGSPFRFKIYGTGDDTEFLFSPLLSGDDIQIIYTTTEDISMGGFGEPGTPARSFSFAGDNGYLKKADALMLADNAAGYLAANASTLGGGTFYVHTRGAI